MLGQNGHLHTAPNWFVCRTVYHLHPPLMALAFMCLVRAGMAIAAQAKTAETIEKRRSRITWHVAVQWLFAGTAALAFYGTYQDKANMAFAHFQSWHAWVGLAGLALSALQLATGFLLNAPFGFVQAAVRSRRPALRSMHAGVAVAVVALGHAAIVLGVWFWRGARLSPAVFWAFVAAVTLSGAGAVVQYLPSFGRSAPAAVASAKVARD